MQQNGTPVKPAVAIYFNPEIQGVEVKVDQDTVHNWDYTLALLGMAQRAVEATMRHQQAAAMQMAMQEQAQNQQLARKVLRSN